MRTIAFSLSPTQTIQCLWLLSTIDALWTLSESGLRLSKFDSTWSANMAMSINGHTSTTLYLDFPRVRVAVGPENIDAARLVIFSKKSGEGASFIIALSKSARRVISRAMSSKK